jgi:phospholipase C
MALLRGVIMSLTMLCRIDHARVCPLRQISRAIACERSYDHILPHFSSNHHAEANDQHAPLDMLAGDQLIADVYDTLRSSASVWEKVGLIITYDEHGAFYNRLCRRPPLVPTASIHPDPTTISVTVGRRNLTSRGLVFAYPRSSCRPG